MQLAFFYFLMAILAGSTVALAGNRPDDGTVITLYADTRLKDPTTGAFIQARRESVTLKELESITLLTRDGVDVLGPSVTEPVEVTLFLPRDMDALDEQAFVMEIESRLNKKFSQPIIKVRRSYIPSAHDLGAVQPELIAPEQLTRLEQWAQKTRHWARKIRQKAHSPQEVDLVMGSVIGGAKSLISISTWIGVSGFNFYSITQMMISLTMSQIFNRYPTQIHQWQVEHKIPWAQNNAIVHYYNTHPILKTIVTGELMSFPILATLRQLRHWDHPHRVHPAWSRDFLVNHWRVALLSAPLSAAGGVAIVNLIRKGYLSPREAQYTYSGLGLISLIGSLFWVNDHKKAWLRVVMAHNVLRAVITGVAYFLPAKRNRLLIVHSDIGPEDHQQIQYVYDLKRIFLNQEGLRRSTLSEVLEQHGFRFDSSPELGEVFELQAMP